MKIKIMSFALAIVATLAILAVGLNIHAVSPPNLAMPDLSGQCLGRGVTFTTALTASNLTSVQSWQVNITFTTGNIATMSYSLGTPFTGPNTFSAANNSTSAGYFLLGMTFYNGAGPYTTTSPVTLVTFTWKTVAFRPTVIFHIVTSGENPGLGTLLQDPSLNSQQYTTTDGFLGCQLGPAP